MFRFSNSISVVFHFALMQNETKNQGCIPRRPKTLASVEQNNRESFLSVYHQSIAATIFCSTPPLYGLGARNAFCYYISGMISLV